MHKCGVKPNEELSDARDFHTGARVVYGSYDEFLALFFDVENPLQFKQTDWLIVFQYINGNEWILWYCRLLNDCTKTKVVITSLLENTIALAQYLDSPNSGTPLSVKGTTGRCRKQEIVKSISTDFTDPLSQILKMYADTKLNTADLLAEEYSDRMAVKNESSILKSDDFSLKEYEVTAILDPVGIPASAKTSANVGVFLDVPDEHKCFLNTARDGYTPSIVNTVDVLLRRQGSILILASSLQEMKMILTEIPDYTPIVISDDTPPRLRYLITHNGSFSEKFTGRPELLVCYKELWNRVFSCIPIPMLRFIVDTGVCTESVEFDLYGSHTTKHIKYHESFARIRERCRRNMDKVSWKSSTYFILSHKDALTFWQPALERFTKWDLVIQVANLARPERIHDTVWPPLKKNLQSLYFTVQHAATLLHMTLRDLSSSIQTLLSTCNVNTIGRAILLLCGVQSDNLYLICALVYAMAADVDIYYKDRIAVQHFMGDNGRMSMFLNAFEFGCLEIASTCKEYGIDKGKVKQVQRGASRLRDSVEKITLELHLPDFRFSVLTSLGDMLFASFGSGTLTPGIRAEVSDYIDNTINESYYEPLFDGFWRVSLEVFHKFIIVDSLRPLQDHIYTTRWYEAIEPMVISTYLNSRGILSNDLMKSLTI